MTCHYWVPCYKASGTDTTQTSYEGLKEFLNRLLLRDSEYKDLRLQQCLALAKISVS